MTNKELLDIISCGETTTVQFKQEWTSQKEIAKEMVAFANTRGGKIIFGVKDKTGDVIGLTYEQIQEISRELGNTANEHIRPVVYVDIEVVAIDSKHVLICEIDKGKSKPYKTLLGEIWIKQGADKRRITENSEILALFQDSGFYQTDLSAVPNTSAKDFNRYDLDEYMKRVHGNTIDGFGTQAEQILKNIHIIHENGNLTLAGYLFFAENPEYKCPTCMVKAVSFYGNDLGGTSYRDSREIVGRMPHVYDQCMSFIRMNLHYIQEKGASFNTLGKPEISESILEEVLQNALIHRDLLRPAPVRLLIFDNRVEIISPGDLAGGLSVNDIRNGKTYQRNPQMALFATNTMRFHGLGSGIVRILQEQKNILLENDINGKEFKVTIPRQGYSSNKLASATNKEKISNTDKISIAKDITDKLRFIGNNTDKSPIKEEVIDTITDIYMYIINNPNVKTSEISENLGKGRESVKKYIQKLVEIGLVCSEGANKNRTYIAKPNNV